MCAKKPGCNIKAQGTPKCTDPRLRLLHDHTYLRNEKITSQPFQFAVTQTCALGISVLGCTRRSLGDTRRCCLFYCRALTQHLSSRVHPQLRGTSHSLGNACQRLSTPYDVPISSGVVFLPCHSPTSLCLFYIPSP